MDHVRVVTCFTRSVANPTGFALECQRDKQLPDEVDYMAIRRREDAEAMDILGVDTERWDLAEAPHRGYESAEELFAGVKPHDLDTVDALYQRTKRVIDRKAVHTLVYPYGAGNHVDHLLVIAAVNRLRQEGSRMAYLQYFDQPYTTKHRADYRQIDTYPEINRRELLACNSGGYRLVLDEITLQRKLAACAAYTSQLGFQFGTEVDMRITLGREEYYLRPA